MAHPLEQLIAFHCAPALAGIKASNLVSCSKEKIPDAKEAAAILNRKLNPKDIYIELLCECPSRLLLMVYRKEKLEAQLQDPAIAAFLADYGYGACSNLMEYVSVLKSRMTGCASFPHEIGAFLGYPLHDICGFLEQTKKCLLVGDWKVYEDADTAKALFCRYKNCRKAMLHQVEKGRHLAEIFHAA